MATCKPEGMVLSAVEHHNLNRPMDILVLAKDVIHQTVDVSNDIPYKIFMIENFVWYIICVSDAKEVM